MGERSDALTAILNRLTTEDGDDSGVARALPFVYDELRGLAEAFLRGERPDHTLQATALVHEVYMRIAGSGDRQWEDRRHFFRLAARTMRHILIDHARARLADRRGGGSGLQPLTDSGIPVHDRLQEILEVDEALEQLHALSPEMAQVVELRFYGGCTIDEASESLGISTATVERHWRFARAWLKAKLSGNE